jgi:hypothetical protein
MTPERFADQFGDLFSQSSYRLELLDTYVAPGEQEPFRRFMAGEPRDDAWRDPWKRFVRFARASGKRMERVHVVTEPLTDYMQFELEWVYPANVEAGEDVRVLPRSAAASLNLPDRDYWLLDSRRVAVMDYDAHGNWTGVDLIDDPDAVAWHLRGRDLALRHSTPLFTYLEGIHREARAS